MGAVDVKAHNPVQGGVPAPRAHLLLAVITILPLLVSVPTNANIVITAIMAVYVGCQRSVKLSPPAESMTRRVSDKGQPCSCWSCLCSQLTPGA